MNTSKLVTLIHVLTLTTIFWSFESSHAQIRERMMVSGQLLSQKSSLEQQFDSWLGERWLLDSDGNTILSAGVQYRKSWINSTSFATPTQVQLAVPAATLVHSLNDLWTMVANVRVGAFSDFESFGMRDVRVEGAVFFDRVYSETLTLGYGLGRVSNFGRVLFVPILHILKNFSDRFLLDVLLPGRAEIWYFPSPKWELGLSASIVGSRYRLSQNSRGVDGLGLAEVDVGPNVRYQFAPQWFLGLEGGVGLARRFNLYLNDTEVAEFKPKATQFVRATLIWRF